MNKKTLIVLICSVVFLSFLGYFAYTQLSYSGELIGILGTNVYHRDNCEFVKKADNQDLIFFKDLTQTANEAYRRCSSCNPPSNKKQVKIAIRNLENELQTLDGSTTAGYLDLFTKKLKTYEINDKLSKLRSIDSN